MEEKEINSTLHRFIVAITFIDGKNQKRYGSGVLISRNAVLTAATNVYDRETKWPYSDIRVYLTEKGQAKE